MKKVVLNHFIKERIEENRELFTKEELEVIEKNEKCINKIYLLGAVNTKNCYEFDWFLIDKRVEMV